MKRILVLLMLIMPASAYAGWEGKLVLGAGKSTPINTTKVEIPGIYPDIVVSAGYAFDNGLSVSLEGEFGFVANLVVATGSVIGSYHFLDRHFWFDPYLLGGIGFGISKFENSSEDDHYNDSSGPCQLYFGLGFAFETTSWLDLGLESRIRIGVPDNPDVTNVMVGLVSVFRFY